MPIAVDAVEQVGVQFVREAELRAFFEASDLLSQPESLRHYRFAPTPAYLEPLAFLGAATGADIADRYGLRRVGLGLMAAQAVLVACYGALRSFWLFLLVSCLFVLAQRGSNAVRNALMGF